MTRMRAGPGRAALVGRRRLPELSSSAASPSSPPRCPPPPPGLRHRPGSLSPRSQGVSPPLGRPAPRPRHPGAGHWGARSRPGFPGAVERAKRGERRAWLSAGQGRARGKVQPQTPSPTRTTPGLSDRSPPRVKARRRGGLGAWHKDARPQVNLLNFLLVQHSTTRF